MRASTVFIIALALLIGLAAAAGGKYFGLFGPKPAVAAPPPPPPPTVILSRVNLYEDIAVTSDQVYSRAVQPQEEASLRATYGEAWRDKMITSASAAHLRVALKNIPADTILLRSHLSEAVLPPSMTAGLEPNMRPVNVAVPKDKAAGGVVRVGEYVDVFLTTKITSGGREDMQTAPIARACKIIMKRNIIWPVSIGDPDNQPLKFTLQANPYRAALIDYAQSHGQLSLFPVAAPLKTTSTFSDPNSSEYATEDQRIEELAQNRRTIGADDLARIFRVVPPTPVIPGPPPVRVTHIFGTQYSGGTTLAPFVPTTTPAPKTPGAPTPNETGAAPKGNGTESNVGAAPKATGTEPTITAAGYSFRK